MSGNKIDSESKADIRSSNSSREEDDRLQCSTSSTSTSAEREQELKSRTGPEPKGDPIATINMITNEVVMMDRSILNHGGKVYKESDIAFKWKKDCRMWLWKNTKEFKKSRAVAVADSSDDSDEDL